MKIKEVEFKSKVLGFHGHQDEKGKARNLSVERFTSDKWDIKLDGNFIVLKETLSNNAETYVPLDNVCFFVPFTSKQSKEVETFLDETIEEIEEVIEEEDSIEEDELAAIQEEIKPKKKK